MCNVHFDEALCRKDICSKLIKISYHDHVVLPNALVGPSILVPAMKAIYKNSDVITQR